MKISLVSSLALLSFIVIFYGCKKDDETFHPVPPSDGNTLTLDGGEGAGNAKNSVYVDLSSGQTDTVVRSSWDLGFFCGPDFRVILNYTVSTGAKVLDKTELSDVNASDTIGLDLTTSPYDPQPDQLAYFDEIDGNLTGTVIPEISAVDQDNKVVIINRGTGGGTPARPWIKAKITRNGIGGYTIEYGNITQTTGFTSISIAKDQDHHFKYINFDSGSLVDAQPDKSGWDFMWTYSLYEANFGWGMVPYNFSDMIITNYLSGVGVATKIYTSDVDRNNAYIAYNIDSVSNTTFITDRWAIGSSWRSTMPATGVKTDRFYVIRDPLGNYYKLKFISMGINDGGVRGKPVFEYKLVQ